jgi:hypothetical protein
MRPWAEEYYYHSVDFEDPESKEYFEKSPYNESLECLEEARVVPDCWRVKIERWNWPVLVIECLEVCVTHDLTKDKLDEYKNLWFDMDASERLHFRLYRMNRDKTMSIVFDKAESVIRHMRPNIDPQRLREIVEVMG